MPLMSEILPGLWMGGCEDGVPLPRIFDFVVSMYPWEKYELHEDVLQRLEFAMYDQRGAVNGDLVAEVAGLINEMRSSGTVLVHCQAGLNRSGLVTAAALVLDGWTAGAAISHLRARRGPAVLCNPDFEAWLRGFGAARPAA
jgi:protein-tyrosine phosphatase